MPRVSHKPGNYRKPGFANRCQCGEPQICSLARAEGPLYTSLGQRPRERSGTKSRAESSPYTSSNFRLTTLARICHQLGHCVSVTLTTRDSGSCVVLIESEASAL